MGGSGSSEAIFGALLARLPDRDGFERTLAAIRQRPDMESFDTLRLDDGCCLEVVSKALSNDELESLFDLGYHTKNVDTIFARVFGEPHAMAKPRAAAGAR